MEILRSYELSVWSLQDSFITVLKPSNLEFKEQIVDPNMSLKDDGDNKLSFKIPMYILNDLGKYEENPKWYNIKNGIIIANLRKIKVIFNKTTSDEEVYEFIIINVKEKHEGYKKYCEIDCEGLAFHELGKQGYKISLEGKDEIEAAQKEYFEKNTLKNYPQPNINYWADKVFGGTNWKYSVQMDWSAHDGITHQIYTTAADGKLDSDNYSSFIESQKRNFNTERENDGLRRRDKIYEDEYVSSWKEKNGKLIPISTVKEKEKYRLVNAKESNRYNLSQTIAETFQVYCKYKYYYDDNYHIIGREVIFYNNFLNESQGIIDLTYKYNTERLTRVMDSTDTINKMFVRPLTDGDTPTGKTTIGDAESNKSLEDYILNFDYMLNVGTITQEQYDEIEPYYLKLRKLNQELIEKNEELIVNEREKIKQEARKKTAEDALASDNEAVENNLQLAQDIGNEDGTISVDANNPQMIYLIPEENGEKYYCNFKTQGIIKESVKLYWNYNNILADINARLTVPVGGYRFITDDSGNLIKATNITKSDPNKNVIYAIYNYNPNVYYNNVIQTFRNRVAQDNAIIEDAKDILGNEEDVSGPGIYGKIKELKQEIDSALIEKEETINAFERMMGPALREGQWQPEDEYAGYGEIHEEERTFNDPHEENELLSLIWDTELFDDEQECYFYFGAEYVKCYYPCIRITDTLLNNFGLEKLTFVYKNSSVGDELSTTEYMSINSKMVTGFIKKDAEIIPVLILLGAENISSEEQLRLLKNGFLAILEENGDISDNHYNVNSNNAWAIKPEDRNTEVEYKTVFPRFIINSLRIKSPETEICVKSENRLLKNYEDFYILSRIKNYTVTLKPHVIFNHATGATIDAVSQLNNARYQIFFTISTAATAVYLDALQVLKENSYPKVSYEIDVMSVNKDFIHNAYKHLGQIAHINDYEFKFENTLGYISELNLDLDKPWQDKVVIKNYKTKFEDLFSTIVAQSEQMKKNSSTITMVANSFNANGTLKGNTIGDSVLNVIVSQTQSAEPTSSPATEYAKYESFIKTQLAQSWQEAGEVLAAAQSSVNDVAAINLKNAAILATFKTNIGEKMTPALFKFGLFKENNVEKEYKTRTKINTMTGLAEETISFKVGDVLEVGRKVNNEYIVDTYMATENSSQINYDEGEVRGTSLKGWSQTQDGSLAQIKGASLDIDAKAGNISLLAENKIDIKAKAELNLSSGKVSIVGNNEVEIGGPDVKIYAASTDDLSKGIHLYSTVLGAQSATNAIDITGDGIKMQASKGIRMQSGGGISFSVSDGNTSTSAIEISRANGIYLGSNQTITLFSGNSVSSDGSGASVGISKDRIMFGLSNSDAGTSVYMDTEKIVIGAAKTLKNDPSSVATNSTSSSSNTIYNSGVYISKTAIKLATGTDSDRAYVNMDSNGVTIAQATAQDNGAIVKVNKNGVSIGVSSAKSTDNNKSFIENITNDISSTNNTVAKFEVYAPNFVVTKDGKLYAYDANIGGTIRATGGEIGFAGSKIQIGSSTVNNITYGAIYSGSKSSLKSNESGFYLGTNGLALGAYDSTAGHSSFEVDTSGSLYANNADIKGTIRATGGTIGGWTIGTTKVGNIIHQYITTNVNRYTYNQEIAGMTLTADGIGAYDNNNQYFTLSTTGKLTAINADIKGTIKATSLYIGANESELSVGSDGKIELSSINKGNLAEMTIDDSGYITLSSAQTDSNGGSLSNNSNVRIGPNKIFINSNGTIDINSTNFKVNSAASGDTSIFYVGNNNDKYIRYSANNGLEVKGKIDATGGSIGGWNIGTDFIGNGTSEVGSQVGMRIPSNDTGTVFWAGHDTTKTSLTDSKFRVTKGGELHATGADISGKITATSGTIGKCNIDTEGNLIVPSANITGSFSYSGRNFIFKTPNGKTSFQLEMEENIIDGSTSVAIAMKNNNMEFSLGSYEVMTTRGDHTLSYGYGMLEVNPDMTPKNGYRIYLSQKDYLKIGVVYAKIKGFDTIDGKKVLVFE